MTLNRFIIDYIKVILFFFLFLFVSCKKNEIKASIKERYKTIDSFLSESGVYSNSELDSLRIEMGDLMQDSIQYPYVFSLEFYLKDIIDFKTNKSDYILKSDLAFYNKSKDIIIKKDSLLDLNPDDFLEVEFEGTLDSGDTFFSDMFYGGYLYHHIEKDSLHQWEQNFESKKYHNWQMHDYPFDIQTLTVRIKSLNDTTITRLVESKDYPASYAENLSLPEGFKIKSIDFAEKFEKTPYFIYDEEGNKTQQVISVGEFSINIQREGGSLFIKLFLGAFLSLLLSISVFYVPTEEFDAKAQLSVGAIFAAVGNKYFVDSSTISNVLTASDVINNLVILIVIFNVFVIIAQRSNRLNLLWLDKEGNGIKLSIFFTIFIIIATFLSYL